MVTTFVDPGNSSALNPSSTAHTWVTINLPFEATVAPSLATVVPSLVAVAPSLVAAVPSLATVDSSWVAVVPSLVIVAPSLAADTPSFVVIAIHTSILTSLQVAIASIALSTFILDPSS